MMNENEIVSVVIPCYNAEKYIDGCLKSICNQTYEDLDIICVDDGSSDRTCKIIERYMMVDKRIKLIKQRNMFAGVARNNGLKEAAGRYVIFLDADDFFSKDMIEKMLNHAINNNADIVLCDAYFYDDITKEVSEPNRVLNRNLLKQCKDVFSYKDIKDDIFNVSWGVPWNKLYSKKFVVDKSLQFQNIKRHNDEFFVCMSMVLAERICFVDERFVYYRRNNENSLQAYTGEEQEYGFYTALSSVISDLKKYGIFDYVGLGFRDKCLTSCINLLKKQKSLKAFTKLYQFLKEKAFSGLEIDDIILSRAGSYAEEYKRIMEWEPNEYLFYRAFGSGQKSEYFFPLPYQNIGNSKKIAIYAAGKVGREYYKQILDGNYYHLTAWFDRDYKRLREKGLPVEDPQDLGNYEFEKIIIAIENDVLAQQIQKELIQKGVGGEKIIWKI